ncbi:MAG: DNA-3-methyladenine glycosylase I [Chloroflexi bacterium]|nr:DNA-3-methyladenine glycosylase I [Chloroflexota bacterium]
MDQRRRCQWAESDPLLQAYHDDEWGFTVKDSRALWEKLITDGFQAGLSWIIILRKREAFREAFQGFDPAVVARYTEDDVKRLLDNPGIVRSRAKIEAAIGNARAYLAMADAGEDFSTFVWSLAGDVVVLEAGSEIPVKSERSEAISAALKKRGFKLVGPVIVYAWMQAVGMVNDHTVDCFRRSGDGAAGLPTPV